MIDIKVRRKGNAMKLRYMIAAAPAVLIAACAATPDGGAPANVASPAPTPTFESVQPDLLGVVGSLSNAWADFDNDGDLDLAVTLKSGEIRLYRNDNGVLTSVGAAMGLPTSGHELRGISWGDYNNDGYVDLLAGASDKAMPTLVFRNEGNRFVEVGAEIGLTIPNRAARQTNFVDYDNDGDLDVYSTDRGGENKLWRNDGGKFTQVFIGAGPTDARPTVGACWFDFDMDGDLDLFLANQSGATDALWRNDGDSFTDVAPELGLDNPGRDRSEGGVGCAVGDFDNDGYFDLFVPNYGHNKLYKNNGDGTFTSVGDAVGLGAENHAVGAAWGDYDNDGWLDLSVMSYEGPPGEQTPLNALFHSKAGQTFVNVIGEAPLLNAGDHGVVWVDYDRDGGLDLSLTDGYGPTGGHFVFRNLLPEAARQRSLSVLVLDKNGHFTRGGAEVRLFDASGKILASRIVTTGEGYNAQSATPLFFGLQSLDAVTVETTFMSKDGRKKQTVHNVKPTDYAGKSLVVREAD